MTGVCVAQMDPWAQSFVIRGARVRLRRDKGGNSLVSHCMAQTLTPCTKYLHLWFMTLDMLWPLQYAQVSAYHPTSYFQLSIPLWPRRAPPSVSPRTSSPSQPSHATNRSHSIVYTNIHLGNFDFILSVYLRHWMLLLCWPDLSNLTPGRPSWPRLSSPLLLASSCGNGG